MTSSGARALFRCVVFSTFLIAAAGCASETPADESVQGEQDADYLITPAPETFAGTVTPAQLDAALKSNAAWIRMVYRDDAPVMKSADVSAQAYKLVLINDEDPNAPIAVTFKRVNVDGATGRKVRLTLSEKLQAGGVTAVKSGNMNVEITLNASSVGVVLTTQPTLFASVFGSEKLSKICANLQHAMGQWIVAESKRTSP